MAKEIADIRHDASSINTEHLSIQAANIKPNDEAAKRAFVLDFLVAHEASPDNPEQFYDPSICLYGDIHITNEDTKEQGFIKVRVAEIKANTVVLSMSLFVKDTNGVTEKYLGNLVAPKEINALANYIVHNTKAYIVYDTVNKASMFTNDTVAALESFDNHWTD